VVSISRLIWDARNYEVGLDRGVLYPVDSPGIAWNGLSSIQEDLESEEQMRYIDGIKKQRNRTQDKFSGIIEAFTYPEPFPRSFGLSYRVGNKIHIVYNVLLGSTGFNYRQLDTEPFSWNFTTKPVSVPGTKRSAHLIVNGSKAYSWTLAALEDILYGSDSTTPRLPLPDEVLNIFDINSILKVTDNGDGTFIVEGPDDVIIMLDSTTFQIIWPSAVYIDEVSYTISSL
jgi:hypothetical protein